MTLKLIKMVKIPEVKISKSGDLHYIAIPLSLIKSEILNHNRKYSVEITPIIQSEINHD